MTLLFTFSFLLFYFVSWMRVIFNRKETKRAKAAMMIFSIVTMILGIYPALQLTGIYLIAEIVLVVEFILTIFLYIYDKKTGVNNLIKQFADGEISPFDVLKKVDMRFMLIFSFLGAVDTIAAIFVVGNMIIKLL